MSVKQLVLDIQFAMNHMLNIDMLDSQTNAKRNQIKLNETTFPS